MDTLRDRGDASRSGRAPASRRSLCYFVLVEAATVAGVVIALLATGPLSRNWGAAVLLAVLAVVFEEAASRLARLKLRLTAGIKRDMTSVWCIAAAVCLPPGHGALLVAVVMAYVWFRQQRPAGESLSVKVFNSSTAIAGCLLAALTFSATVDALPALPLALASTLAVAVAIAVHAGTNRVLVTLGGLTIGMKLRDLIGSREDNLVEVATLCLGGLVGIAVAYQPWSALFVLVPMLALQRGAVVRDLEAAAITDAKTGLLNAVAWEQLAKRELERAYRAGTTVSVAILDIDRFKVVNDRFGHLVGDKVLASVARAVKESLRGYDGLGRFGGEEFVIVLPDSDQREALVVAERVRLRVNRLCVLDAVPELDDTTGRAAERLSVSIGVAVLNSDGAELQDLLHAADQALYRAKWNGRNQVQLARRGDQLPDTVAL